MHVIRKINRLSRSDRGQVILIFVGILTIIALMAAVAIDGGLWLSERRGAQKDADLTTLAGAYELLAEGSTAAQAEAAVHDWADLNDLGNLSVENLVVKSLDFPAGFEDQSRYCIESPDNGERLNAVALDAGHDSSALFARMFDVAAPDIGAYACARAGSLISTRGLHPWAITPQECVEWSGSTCVTEVASPCFTGGVPQFGARCVFRTDDPSVTRALRLGTEVDSPCGPTGGGTPQYKENIIEGADALCSIGDIIRTEPGLAPNPTFQAIQDRLATEGECDSENGDGDGIDEFDESFETIFPTDDPAPGPDVTFTARDCNTPRAIDIVILKGPFPNAGLYSGEIEGFAAFFFEQCEVIGGPDAGAYPKCNMPGGDWGNVQIVGFFMKVLELEGDIGDFNPFGTLVIRLVQ